MLYYTENGTKKNRSSIKQKYVRYVAIQCN